MRKISAVLIGFATLACVQARATDFYWDGDSDGYWNNALNWTADSGVPTTDDLLFFGGTVRVFTTNDILADKVFSGIQLATTAGQTPMVIDSAGGGQLHINGNNIRYYDGTDGFNNGMATISADLAADGDLNIFVEDGADDIDLTISGDIDLPDSGGGRGLIPRGWGTLMLTGGANSDIRHLEVRNEKTILGSAISPIRTARPVL